ncbi:MAG: UbiA family prenyltransferase [Myxococcota bacterium]
MNFFKAVFITSRPQQWIKNLFIFFPLIFSRQLQNPGLILDAVCFFIQFCLTASAVYFFNDIIDIDKDRLHPQKKKRPVAAGEISIVNAYFILSTLLLFAFAPFLITGSAAIYSLLAYIILNIAYSNYLKHIVFIDVLSISAGFLLRVTGGSAAIGVYPSEWLLIMTLLLSLFLGFGKRTHELLYFKEKAPLHRLVLKKYSLPLLRLILLGLILIIPIVFISYSFIAHKDDGKNYLFTFSSPLILLSLFRFYQLTTNKEHIKSPTESMLKDPLFMFTSIFWCMMVLMILYM